MDREKVIEGIEAIREFFGFGLPSQSPVFEAYQRILTDAIALLKEQGKSSCNGCECKGSEDCPLDHVSDGNVVCLNGRLNTDEIQA